jgi:hypothetical protein
MVDWIRDLAVIAPIAGLAAVGTFLTFVKTLSEVSRSVWIILVFSLTLVGFFEWVTTFSGHPNWIP